MPSVDRETAIELLDVQPARVVAMTAKSGTLLDEDGDTIDPRQTEPWVWALGPYGSWPETLVAAIARLNEHEVFGVGRSIRLGRVVIFKPGWGFAAKPIEAAVAYAALVDLLSAPVTPELLAPLDGDLDGYIVSARLMGATGWVAQVKTTYTVVATGIGPTVTEATAALAAKLRELAAGEVSGG